MIKKYVTHEMKSKFINSIHSVKTEKLTTGNLIVFSATLGEPGIDYPIYSIIPKTNFNCSEQRYKGFFGDPDTGCQVWHYCDLNGGQASFL